MSTLLFDSGFNLNRKRVKLYTFHLYLQVKKFSMGPLKADNLYKVETNLLIINISRA